jgi:hypothetical protein
MERRFKAVLRIKKGIIHNSIRQIGWFRMKNKVYLEGYQMFWRTNNINKNMYFGKVKEDHLHFLKD